MLKIFFAILLATAATSAISGQESNWSKPVNGLRARLEVLPPEKLDTPFCRVFIEMQNVSDILGQLRIRFTPQRLNLFVSPNGQELKKETTQMWSGLTPNWETTLLPSSGTIKFQVSLSGAGYRPDSKSIL